MELKLITENTDSRDLAIAVDKRHSDLLRSIRSMEKAYEKVTGKRFNLKFYKGKDGRMFPYYSLERSEAIYIATKFSDDLLCQYICLDPKTDILQMIRNTDFRRKEDVFYDQQIISIFDENDVVRQFRVGDFRVDFYVVSLNLAIEFDEKHHGIKGNIEKDFIRQQKIEKMIGCNFVRVLEGEKLIDKLDQQDLYSYELN